MGKKVTIAGRQYEAGADDYTKPNPDAARNGQKPQEFTKEHQTIKSRTTGKDIEIKFGPLPGGLVPANPFASQAQAGYLHAHPEKLGAKKLAEFDQSTKGMKLPKRVKKEK
jgi:hypothetical protein